MTTQGARPSTTKKQQEAAAVAEAERAKALERIGQALSRLRDTERQLPETLTHVATLRAGDNPYVKTLSDMESAGARMQEQFGHLGAGAVQLFTTLEQQSLRGQLAVQRVNSLTEAIHRQSQAARERDQLELGTDLTRGESARVETLKLQTSALRRLPEMEFGLARLLGTGLGAGGAGKGRQYFADLRAQDYINTLQARYGGPGVGVGREDRATKEVINQAVLDTLGQFPAAVIRNTPWMRDAYRRAVEGQMSEIRNVIDDSINRERLISRENTRLVDTAAQLDRSRDEALRTAQSELERRQVGRAFDRSLIQETEGYSARELAQLGLFDPRNRAIQREAERSVQEQAEAQQAIIEGLAVNKAILSVAEQIRSGLLGGDMSLLVQVENNARAEIDAEDLKALGQRDVDLNLISPRRLGGATKVSRYSRGGRRE
jgi:hypothetical protein